MRIFEALMSIFSGLSPRPTGCEICGAARAPDLERCPDCLLQTMPRVGISDEHLTAAELYIRMPQLSDWQLSDNTSYAITDMGHAVYFDETGAPRVLLDDAWVDWDTYISSV